jgi:hypothetical protein
VLQSWPSRRQTNLGPLVFDAKDFAINANEIQRDGRAYLEAENQKTSVALSAYLEKIDGQATAPDCVASQTQRLAPNASFKIEGGARKSAAGAEIVEYPIPEVQGMPIHQRNRFACIPKDDV